MDGDFPSTGGGVHASNTTREVLFGASCGPRHRKKLFWDA